MKSLKYFSKVQIVKDFRLIILIISLSFLSLQSTTISQTAGKMFPAGGEIFKNGNAVMIFWNEMYIDGTVTISLWDASECKWTILESNINANECKCTIRFPENVEGKRFRIKIQSDKDNMVASLTRAFFEIQSSHAGTDISGIRKPEILSVYPNPCKPGTTFKFFLKEESSVRIIVRDILGKEVQKIMNDQLDKGAHSKYFDTSVLPSGIYYYTAFIGNELRHGKVSVLK